jgi:hypothetical protein
VICRACTEAAGRGDPHDGCRELARAQADRENAGAYQPVGRAGAWCDCQHHGTPQKLTLTERARPVHPNDSRSGRARIPITSP